LKNFATIIFLAITSSAFGQTIRGEVIDDSGKSAFKASTATIGYATVELLDSSAITRIFTHLAGKDGEFGFRNIAAGVYCIEVGSLFYKDTTFRNIKITGDTTLTLPLHRLK
jgi:hypothetical protein